MATELDQQQWQNITEGHVISPSGTRYARRSTRLARRRAAELVEASCPVLVYLWSYGQLDWFEPGAEARAAWEARRRSVTDQEPRPTRPRQDPVWTAERWESADADVLLLLNGRC